MKKILFGLGAALLALALTGDAKAAGPGGRGHRPGPAVSGRAYYLDHGVRYNGGYMYRGRDHHHWGYRVWNTRFNRYQYWDPSLRCYYYWSPVQVAYLPCP